MIQLRSVAQAHCRQPGFPEVCRGVSRENPVGPLSPEKCCLSQAASLNASRSRETQAGPGSGHRSDQFGPLQAKGPLRPRDRGCHEKPAGGVSSGSLGTAGTSWPGDQTGRRMLLHKLDVTVASTVTGGDWPYSREAGYAQGSQDDPPPNPSPPPHQHVASLLYRNLRGNKVLFVL